jgi:hypothetical protein
MVTVTIFSAIGASPPSAHDVVFSSTGGDAMITAFVQFRLPQPVTPERAKDIFLSTAPKYRGTPGLLRKYYVLSQDGTTAGGVYLWQSRQDAEREWSLIAQTVLWSNLTDEEPTARVAAASAFTPFYPGVAFTRDVPVPPGEKP